MKLFARKNVNITVNLFTTVLTYYIKFYLKNVISYVMHSFAYFKFDMKLVQNLKNFKKIKVFVV
jgi:hypothetical protein